MATPPTTGVFAGMAVADLQSTLSSAQLSLIKLETGAMTATVSYGEGSGNRSVTFTRADPAKLRQLIRDLQAALGMRSRHAIAVSFS